jgi:hypothetical protein
MSLVGDYYSSSSDDDGEIKITGNRKEKKKIYISLTNKDFDSSDEERFIINYVKFLFIKGVVIKT